MPSSTAGAGCAGRGAGGVVGTGAGGRTSGTAPVQPCGPVGVAVLHGQDRAPGTVSGVPDGGPGRLSAAAGTGTVEGPEGPVSGPLAYAPGPGGAAATVTAPADSGPATSGVAASGSSAPRRRTTEPAISATAPRPAA